MSYTRIPKQAVQSVIFNKLYFNEDKAKAWLRSHGFKTAFKPPHKTVNFIRFRQFNPPRNGKYITRIIGRGIEYIILI